MLKRCACCSRHSSHGVHYTGLYSATGRGGSVHTGRQLCVYGTAQQHLPGASGACHQPVLCDTQQGHFRPAQTQVGALVLQQATQPQPQQVGLLVLQQPMPPKHLWRAPASFKAPAQPQPQLCQRAAQPMRPETLTAADGYVVSRRERYMSPEAAAVQGHFLPATTLNTLEVNDADAAAAAAAAQTADTAAAAAPATAENVPNAQVLLQSSSRTCSNPKLVVAAQACVLEPPAALPAVSAAPPAAAAAETTTPQLKVVEPMKQQARRRRRTSTSHSSSSSSSNSRSSNSSNSRHSDIMEASSRASTSSSPSSLRAYPSAAPPDLGTKPSHSGHSIASAAAGHTSCAQQSSTRSTGSTTAIRSSTSSSATYPAASPGGVACQPAPHDSSSNRSSRHSTQFNHTGSKDSRESEQQLLLQLVEALSDRAGIELSAHTFGQQRCTCPHCEGGSSGEDCFSVRLDLDGSAVWNCFRATCGFSGGFQLPVAGSRRKRRSSSSSSSSGGNSSSTSCVAGSTLHTSRMVQVSQQSSAKPLPAGLQAQLRPLSPTLKGWLQQQRGISPAVLARNRVCMQRQYIPALHSEQECIAFPYFSGGELVNIKYRALPKHFTQVKGGQQVFYGLDDLQGATDAIIVEGEMDKLAIETATGATAVLSIPSGALPAHKHSQLPSYTKKLACVHQAAQQLSQLQRCIIALDGDTPGHTTTQAVAREVLPHLGSGASQPVWYLAWPSAAAGGSQTLLRVAQAAAAQGLAVDSTSLAAAARCKDANDLLLACGRKFLQLYVQLGAVPFHGLPGRV